MSLFPGLWMPGHAAGYWLKFNRARSALTNPNKVWPADCPECSGTGESASVHRLVGGYSHIPCWKCGGTGEQEELPMPLGTAMTPTFPPDVLGKGPVEYIGTKRVWAWPETKTFESGGGDYEREGYGVMYEDGYRSWSPQDVFEAAYQPTTAMSFGGALLALKAGKAVARAGWNGRQPVVGFIPPSRAAVVYEGLCYILLATGDVAYCDAEDAELVGGQEHWTLMGNGYPAYTDNATRETVHMHRLIVPGGEEVDHINGNKLDNRRRNLRPCTAEENAANRASVAGSSSRFKGVTWDASRGKWMAAIANEGVSRTLGRFDSEEDAARAYDKAATAAYGRFARLNFAGPGMFICLMPPLQLPPYSTQGTERKVNDRTAKWIGEDAPLDCQPYFAMYTAKKQWQPGWLASQADMLADDWMIVEVAP